MNHPESPAPIDQPAALGEQAESRCPACGHELDLAPPGENRNAMATMTIAESAHGDPAKRAYELANKIATALDAGATPHAVVSDCKQLSESVLQLDLSAASPLTTEYVLRGALEVARALYGQDLSTSATSVRLGVETVSQALDRLADDQVVADARPLSEVIDWTLRTTHIRPAHLARILEVAPSTVARWQSGRRLAESETDEMRRARILARVVLQLSHVLTGHGVVSWLETENPAFKGMKPKELLSEPERVPDLIRVASRGRSQAAS